MNKDINNLSADSILALIELVQREDKKSLQRKKALEMICIACDGWVRGVVRSFLKRGAVAPSSFDDFMQEGRIALCRAVEKYDKNKGVLFRTYATACIKGGIRDVLRETSPLTREMMDLVPDVNDIRLMLIGKLARVPTLAELKHHLPERLLKKFEEIRMAELWGSSGDFLGDEIDRLPDQNNSTIEEMVDFQRLYARVLVVVGNLCPTKKQRIIFLSLNEIENEGILTVNELAVLFGVSDKRIHQINIEVLTKLKLRMKLFLKLGQYRGEPIG